MSEQGASSVSGTRAEDQAMDSLPERLVRWAGAYTILFIGVAHILICGEHFLIATYLGLLFVANFLGSLVVATGLFLRYKSAWLLGNLIAGGSFIGFVVSRIIELPGAPEFVGQWFNIAALNTLALDGLFIFLSLLAITPPGRALVRTQTERLKQEQAAGQKQPVELPLLGAPLKAPGLLEQEMAEIRSRTAPDLVDLRRQVEPQVVKERAQQSAVEYLQSIRNALVSNSGSRQPGPLAALVVAAAVTLLVIRRRGSGRDD